MHQLLRFIKTLHYVLIQGAQLSFRNLFVQQEKHLNVHTSTWIINLFFVRLKIQGFKIVTLHPAGSLRFRL